MEISVLKLGPGQDRKVDAAKIFILYLLVFNFKLKV